MLQVYEPFNNYFLDSQSPWTSVVLSEEYFGSPDPETHEIRNGPFSIHEYTCPIGGRSLVRDYDSVKGTDAFFAQSLIDLEMQKLVPFSHFSLYIEDGPHATVHSILV
jgi:hypothetical protein